MPSGELRADNKSNVKKHSHGQNEDETEILYAFLLYRLPTAPAFDTPGPGPHWKREKPGRNSMPPGPWRRQNGSYLSSRQAGTTLNHPLTSYPHHPHHPQSIHSSPKTTKGL
jgi:hypothetical protein